MFIGEFLLFIVYWIIRRFCQSSPEANHVPVSKWFLFLLPALLDVISSTTIFIGLNLTYASSLEMLRGTVSNYLNECAHQLVGLDETLLV